MARVSVDFRLSPKSRSYPDKLRKRIKSRGDRTPSKAVKTLGQKVMQEILRQYDATLSQKNVRRRGSSQKLRRALKMSGPFIEDGDTVRVELVKNLPSYWRFVEFGIGPSHREQTYQIVGPRGPRRLPFGTGRAFREGAAGATEILGSELWQQNKGGLRLIPRKAIELKRLKRKITIEFSHPGFKGHHFVRAGIIYANRNGKAILEDELRKMFEAAGQEVGAE